MASILAFADPAWLADKAPGGARVGDLISTGSYEWSDSSFAPLQSGGFLFLITPHEPDRTLLVAVLEDPRFRGTDPLLAGDGWYAGDNRCAVVEVTGVFGELAAAPTSGGASRVRVLAEPDERLLMDIAQPIQVMAAPFRGSEAQRLRERARRRTDLQPLRFDNHRRARPLAAMTPEDQRRLHLFLDAIRQQHEFGGVEAVDIIDKSIGRVAWVLYCWPFRDGVLVDAQTDRIAGDVSDGVLEVREPNRALQDSLMMAYDLGWERLPWFREIALAFREPDDLG